MEIRQEAQPHVVQECSGQDRQLGWQESWLVQLRIAVGLHNETLPAAEG
jgi:hypothetical protein